mgnify:FL=1
MAMKLTRRQILNGLLIGGVGTGIGLSINRYPVPIKSIHNITDAVNYSLHDLLLSGQPLAREFSRNDVVLDFPTSGVTAPRDERYQLMREASFADYRLRIDGLVDNPASYSLTELRNLPAQSQITLHTCDEGWSAIGEWRGVSLSMLLSQAGLQDTARYVVFHCMDTQFNERPYYESLDLLAATHPQTMLAYDLNGEPLPQKNGAPLRLRIETQIGYKHTKFVERVEVVDSLAGIGNGRGGWWEDYDNAVWYAGL